MGEIFFFIRMAIYTLVFVIIMQVKVGPTTLEQKVIEFTHHSQMAGTIQKVAQGATIFIGAQYQKLMGHLNSKYIEQQSQTRGDRLKQKIQEWKQTLDDEWKNNKGNIKDIPMPENPLDSVPQAEEPQSI